MSLSVPDRPTFEVTVERETDGDDPELSVEFELEWKVERGRDTAGEDGDLSIE